MSDSEDSVYSDNVSVESDGISSASSSRSTSPAVSRRSASRTPSRSRSRSRSSGRGKNQDDEPEEVRSDSEGEDLDSEEEDVRHGKKIKKRKTAVSDFILQEAEVDDEVEDDEEWEDGAEEAAIDNEIDEFGPTARDIDGRRRGHDLLDFPNEDKLMEYFENKYNNVEPDLKFGEGGSKAIGAEITQQMLLPGVKDPNLWMVRCRMGEEKNTCLLLMRKFLAYENSDSPLKIKSVVVPEGVKGYVYIETYKAPFVKTAIENVGSLRAGYHKQQMVPISEMTDVLRITKEKQVLNIKQWVRIKSGRYKDDIAQVDYVEPTQNKVHLKLIPRIDYRHYRGALKSQNQDHDGKRKKTMRPPAKLFDPKAVRAIGGQVTSDGDFWLFEGQRYSRKGFLYKDFKIHLVISAGIKPTLSELEKFEVAPENADLEINGPLLTTSNTNGSSHTFSAGDNVEVVSGELTNLQGKITKVYRDIIYVTPFHPELKHQELEFRSDELQKYFKIGDHVKVIAGRHEGETGLVIRVENNRVVVFADLSMHELEVLARDIQLCPDTATGVDSLGKFQWGDLVNLDPQTVGVIVRLERDSFEILSMHGKVVKARPQSLTKRKENRHQVALDSQKNDVHVKDIVKVVDGPYDGRGGEIRYIYRNFAFVHSKEVIDNGGILVCKNRHLQLAGGSKAKSFSCSTSNPGFMSPRITSPAHGDTGASRGAGGSNIRVASSAGGDRGCGGGGGRNGGRGGGYRSIVGTTIKIIRGMYKGNIGIVKDATETVVRVEMHATCQTISVNRNNILAAAAPANKGGFSGYNRTPAYTGQTPMYSGGCKTPMYGGSQTPMYPGSMTPMYGSQAPDYEPAGSRTPYYGSMTPTHDGSRTLGGSAWDPMVTNTPAHPSFNA